MKIVERFIDFTRWPTSRKTVLLGCLSAPTTLLAALVNHLIQSHAATAPMVNLGLLTPFLGFWVLAQAACAAIAWSEDRQSRDSRWTAYLYVVLNAPMIVAINYLYGTMGTPLVAIVPTIVILWILYFGETVATFGFALMLVSLAGVHALETAGVLRYAPMLLRRGIDAQQTPSWFVAGFAATLFLLCFSFSICLLILAARRLQEQRLHQAQRELERINQLIRRYLPDQLAQAIADGQHLASSKPERRKLTICFSEIEGFTDATQALSAEQLERILNLYFSEMMAIADAHGATVNQLVGDSIMMFFGAPLATDDRDHALRALRMSLAMQRRIAELDAQWLQLGLDKPLRARIGINTGYASVGDFGSEGRKLYSGIGLQTNVAARIQSACEPGRVLISHPTWALVNAEIGCVPRGEIAIKGVHYPVRVYEIEVACLPQIEPENVPPTASEARPAPDEKPRNEPPLDLTGVACS